MVEVHYHLRDGHNLILNLPWIWNDTDYKVMDKLEIGIGNNLNLDNEVWDDEYNFSYNYGNDIGDGKIIQ